MTDVINNNQLETIKQNIIDAIKDKLRANDGVLHNKEGMYVAIDACYGNHERVIIKVAVTLSSEAVSRFQPNIINPQDIESSVVKGDLNVNRDTISETNANLDDGSAVDVSSRGGKSVHGTDTYNQSGNNNSRDSHVGEVDVNNNTTGKAKKT